MARKGTLPTNVLETPLPGQRRKVNQDTGYAYLMYIGSRIWTACTEKRRVNPNIYN